MKTKRIEALMSRIQKYRAEFNGNQADTHYIAVPAGMSLAKYDSLIRRIEKAEYQVKVELAKGLGLWKE